jgi:hypothetical protein
MLKLRGLPDLEGSNLLVRLEHRVYAPWQAGHDRPVNVLVDVEALAGKPEFTEQISAVLIRHRQLKSPGKQEADGRSRRLTGTSAAGDKLIDLQAKDLHAQSKSSGI